MLSKKNSFIIISFLLYFSLFNNGVFAQTAGSGESHTKLEEKKGKSVAEKLRQNQILCENLKKEDFEALGEHYMGQMLGSSHEAMNNMMTKMMGRESEEIMHEVMGKRLSGCDPEAIYPQSGIGFVPMMSFGGFNGMMNMMGTSAGKTSFAPYNMMNMMGYWFNPLFMWWFGLIFIILLFTLIVVAITALIKWLLNKTKEKDKNWIWHSYGYGEKDTTHKVNDALEILKHRYARGEINRDEFEKMKREII